MVTRTLLETHVYANEITSFVGSADQNGWVVSPDNWSHWAAGTVAGIKGTYAVRGSATIFYRTDCQLNFGSYDAFDIEFDMYFNGNTQGLTSYPAGAGDFLTFGLIFTDVPNNKQLNILCYQLENAQYSNSPTDMYILIQQTDTGSNNLFYYTIPTRPPGLNNGYVTFRIRLQKGQKPKIWTSITAYNTWSELQNQASGNYTLHSNSYSYAKFEAWLEGMTSPSTLDYIQTRFYGLTNLTIENGSGLSVSDDGGVALFGYDPNDNGSGSNTGGSGGFGGGGVTNGSDTVVGGRLNDGAVGSGSEGNINRTGYDTQIGTGDSTALNGSGSGISILNARFTRFLDAFGTAELDLEVVDNWNTLLSFIGKKVAITSDNGTLFRGFVKEPIITDDYRATLVIKETHTKLVENETQYDYAVILTTTNKKYAVISNISGSTITLTDGDTSAVLTDGTHAVMLIPSPGNTPAFSLENWSNLVSGTGYDVNGNADGLTNCSEISLDNKAHILNSPVTGVIEMILTYSGTRANAVGIDFYAKISLITPLVPVTDQLVVQLYNYTSSAYDQIDTRYVDMGFGWLSYELTINIPNDVAGTVTNYIKSADNEMRIRFTYNQYKMKIFYSYLKIYTNTVYNGSAIVVSSLPAGNQITGASSFVTAGFNIGDTIVVGKKNTTVLQELAEEYLGPDLIVSVDSNFTSFTASDFHTNKQTNYEAISSVLKKETGVMSYDPNANVLYFIKKADLTAYSITFANIDTPVYSGVQTGIITANKKEGDDYSAVEVLGATYKVIDSEVQIYAKKYRNGTFTKVLRINDPTITSVTEALWRCTSELAILENKDPTFSFQYISENGPPVFILGFTVNVRFKSRLFTLPIHMISGEMYGKDFLITLQLGWYC